MLTAFVTSSVFVVLPMLGAQVTRLARKHGIDDSRHPGAGEAVISIGFNFPTAGKLLTLLFIPFAAWLSGRMLTGSELTTVLGTGVFTYFAKAQVALPFLLDLAGVPHDLVQLYLPTAIVTGEFDSAVGAMSLFAFGLIVTAAIGGRLTAHAPQLLRFGALGATLIVATVFVTRQALAITIDPPASRAEVVQSMQLSRSDPPSVVHAVAPPADPPGVAALPALERILARGALRMGFMDGRLPLGFTNLAGEPVGFEIEMGVQLARDLDVQLELVAMDLDQVGPYLEAGIVDLVPGSAHTHHWVRRVRLSTPYMDGTFGLMVPDVRRRDFDTIERLRRHDRLRIGILTVPDLRDDYAREIAGPVPYELVRVPADPDSLLGVDRPDVDVILVVAEIGTAWTLLYPDWSVVVPRPVVVRRPLGFALAPSAADLAAFVDSWLVLQEARGNIERGYEYWVLGLGAGQERKRWSIGRDVLHWID